MKKSIFTILLLLGLVISLVACEPNPDLGDGSDSTVAETDENGDVVTDDTTESTSNDDADNGSDETESGGIKVKDENDDTGEWNDPHPLIPVG